LPASGGLALQPSSSQRFVLAHSAPLCGPVLNDVDIPALLGWDEQDYEFLD